MHHPALESSIFFHLNKVVGRVSLAPVEIYKEYMTNKSMAESMTTYTFSKDELEKLKVDLLSNP